jgi:hypothetical protein
MPHTFAFSQSDCWLHNAPSALSPGWPDEFVKISPKITEDKTSPKVWNNFVIFKNLSKINNRTLGENSPNLVTLTLTHLSKQQRPIRHLCMYICRLLKCPETVTLIESISSVSNSIFTTRISDTVPEGIKVIISPPWH